MEDHYAKYPEGCPGHRQNEDLDELQILTPSTGTPTTVAPSTKVTPASSAPGMKDSNARKGGEANTASLGGEANTALGTENTSRGPGRPRKNAGNTASGGSAEVT